MPTLPFEMRSPAAHLHPFYSFMTVTRTYSCVFIPVTLVSFLASGLELPGGQEARSQEGVGRSGPSVAICCMNRQMNVNEYPTPGSRVWVCLTHCLHAPRILWTKRNRSHGIEPTNRNLANHPALRLVLYSPSCRRRFLLPGGCPRTELRLPPGSIAFTSRPGSACRALCLQGCVCPGTVPPSAVPQAPPARLAGEHGGWRETAIANIHPEQANPKRVLLLKRERGSGNALPPLAVV